MYYFMDSGPKFTGLVWLNAGGMARDCVSFRFWISCLVPEIFAIKVGSCVKSVQILHVFGPQIFQGRAPEFLDLDYLIGVDSDHVVKFRGDRPRELRDPVSDLKKHHD